MFCLTLLTEKLRMVCWTEIVSNDWIHFILKYSYLINLSAYFRTL